MPTIRSAAFAAFLTFATTAHVDAQVMPFGCGCAGSAGTPELKLAFGSNVIAGQTLPLQVESLPGNSATMLFGFQRFPDGIDLTPLGMNGCSLYHDAVVSATVFAVNGTGISGISLNGVPPCFEFYAQCAAIDPGANDLGVIMSNAATIAINPAAESHLHTAVIANSANNWTSFSHPSVDGQAGAVIVYTRNAPSPLSADDPTITGIYYNNANDRWAIFNQDRTSMLRGAVLAPEDTYNIFCPNSEASQFVVSAGVSSTITGRITIDHPDLNGNANALIFVSQLWNPGGKGGVYNDSEYDVQYRSGKWDIFNNGNTFPIDAAFNVVIADEHLAVEHAPFLHRATNGNAVTNGTEIDHPALNGNPDARLIVTKNYNPGGTPTGVWNPDPLSVLYDGGRWVIRNQRLRAVPPGACFNVLIADATPRGSQHLHTATRANTNLNTAWIDHAPLNGDRDAFAILTQHRADTTSAGAYNPHPAALWYDLARSRWSVFNEDRSAMPLGAAFNVLVPNSGATKLVVTANSSNLLGNTVEIDHPALNGNPDAMLFACQNWNPTGSSGVYNGSYIGVWYRSSTGRWTIFNESQTDIPSGASFNVLLADSNLISEDPAFEHVATVSNISSGYTTRLDHPLLNGNPNAHLTVTQTWKRGVYNNHPISVFYNGANWFIFNQDIQPVPQNATFNVLIGGDCR